MPGEIGQRKSGRTDCGSRTNFRLAHRSAIFLWCEDKTIEIKGDLSENAEYDAARDAQALLEVKIANLKNLVANAKVLDESAIGTDRVQMLNKVKVENMSMKKVMEFTIVGETEADFAHGKLASTTPIAKALLGHSKGEIVEAKVPSGVMKFKILDITL